MAKTTDTSSKTSTASSPATGIEIARFPLFDPADISKNSSHNLEVATRAARAYFNGAVRLNREMTEFISTRFRKDFETARTLMTIKDGDAALQTQADFIEETLRDYADETSKMLNLAADIAQETLGHAEERAGQAAALTRKGAE
ncbi:MAG: phasin family protein [Pseudomonadota bacterium]